jgi:hypothetical protein
LASFFVLSEVQPAVDVLELRFLRLPSFPLDRRSLFLSILGMMAPALHGGAA